MRTNDHGQLIGDDLGEWTPPDPITPTAIEGTSVAVEPLRRTSHAIPLFHAYKGAPETLWTYVPWGPFIDAAELGQLCDDLVRRDDWVSYAVVVDGNPLGICSYLRMDPRNGVIEIGGITWSPALQRTRASTEAIVLLLRQAFEAGYRRVEWKCDDLNLASRNAAKRFGFTYDGTFRKATHYRGRSRDTAWYSIIDDDWPRIDMRLQTWMDPANFDENGVQRRRLDDLIVGRESPSTA